jgi:GNAT superfamily N-acetyltransferase
MVTTAAPRLTIRPATDADLDAIVALAGLALGWDDGPHRELFSWKHLANPFGRSPMWLGELDGQLAGFRCFLRWELRDGGGRRYRAVRAVDTATHPDFMRRGVFSTLTTAALQAEQAAGTDLVFNTPNDSSRPGYLKLGWKEVGRLPVAVGPRHRRGFQRMRAANVAAAKWSLDSPAGEPAADALAAPAIERLCATLVPPHGLATPRTPAFLRWRYRFEPLHYRVITLGTDPAEGLGIFRLRSRGPAVECTVTDVLVPDGDPHAERGVLRAIRAAVDADYVLRLGVPTLGGRLAPLPGGGPLLTARSLRSDLPTAVGGWCLEMGDIELF